LEKEGAIMFDGLKDFIRQVIKKVFNRSSIENELKVDIAISDSMYRAVNLWSKMYENKAPWLSDTVKSLNIASTVASEFARLVTLEMESTIESNDFLNEQYQVVIDGIRPYIEYACAKGGIIFKPFVNGQNIEVDITHADNFYPTAYNSRGEVTGAVFVDTKVIGEKLYTRLESHNFIDNG
jgi:hypothetical protein